MFGRNHDKLLHEFDQRYTPSSRGDYLAEHYAESRKQIWELRARIEKLEKRATAIESGIYKAWWCG